MAKGVKTGGRSKGTPNKSTQARKEIIEKAAVEAGITPLEVMLQTMRKAWEENDYKVATAVAAQAAPYVHPKLAQIDSTVEGSFTVEIVKFETDTDSE
jgi:hypothetical protein